MNNAPTTLQPYSSSEILIGWSDGQQYILPYLELRFLCPCAHCVDEHTGKRTLQRGSLSPEVHPTDIKPVGRYAVQIHWSDGHGTGLYAFDRLHDICETSGKKSDAKNQ